MLRGKGAQLYRIVLYKMLASSCQPTICFATACGTEIQNLATNGRTQSRRTAPQIPDSESHLCPAQVEVAASQQQQSRNSSRLHIADQLVDRRIVSLELKYLANEVSIHSDCPFFGVPCRLKSQSLHLHADLLKGQYPRFQSFSQLPSLGNLGHVFAIANSDLFQCFFNIHTLCTVTRPSSSQSGQSLQRQGSLHFAPGAPSTETDQYIRSHANRMSSRPRNESFDEGNVQHRPTPGHGSLSQVRCSVRQ